MKRILLLAFSVLCLNSVFAQKATMSLSETNITVASAASADQTATVTLKFEQTEKACTGFSAAIYCENTNILDATTSGKATLLKAKNDDDDAIYTFSKAFKTLEDTSSKLNGKHIYYVFAYSSDAIEFPLSGDMCTFTFKVPAGTADGKYDFILDYQCSGSDIYSDKTDHYIDFSITVGESSGISSVEVDNNVNAYYSVDGQSMKAPKKGINLVKTSNGVKKVMMK